MGANFGSLSGGTSMGSSPDSAAAALALLDVSLLAD